jgi:hypothetical protein
MYKRLLTDCVGNKEPRSKGNHMYSVRNLATFIFWAGLHSSLWQTYLLFSLPSAIFFLALDRSGWWKGLPLPVGKWIKNGHDSVGNSAHNLSGKKTPLLLCLPKWRNFGIVGSNLLSCLFFPTSRIHFVFLTLKVFTKIAWEEIQENLVNKLQLFLRTYCWIFIRNCVCDCLFRLS